MSEKESTAKELGKKAKKVAGKDAGYAIENERGSYQLGYGIDYFGDTAAQKHAKDIEIKAKALQDIRDIYAAEGKNTSNIISTLNVTDEDVKAYKAFLDLEYLRDFDFYTGDKFLKGANPAQVKWIHDIYPDIFQRRVDELDKVLNVQKKVAMLNIMGPRSKEDLLFMYELNLFKKKNPAKYTAIIETPVSKGTGVEKYTRGALSVADMFSNYPSLTERASSGGKYASLLGQADSKISKETKFEY